MTSRDVGSPGPLGYRSLPEFLRGRYWNLAPNVTPPKKPTSFLGDVVTRNNTNLCSWSKIIPCCLAGGYQFTVCSSTAGITLNASSYCPERYLTHLRSLMRNRPINLVQGEHYSCIRVVPSSVSYYQCHIAGRILVIYFES